MQNIQDWLIKSIIIRNKNRDSKSKKKTLENSN